MGTPESLQPRTLLEWQLLTGSRISTNEAAILFEMDRAFRSAWNAESTRQAKGRKTPGKGS